MRKMKLWMFAAILTICGTTLLTSCIDYVDNPAPSSYAANESQAQAKFWEKFNQWQTVAQWATTSSCT